VIAAFLRTTATTSTISPRARPSKETCYLLWHGRLPNRAELGDLQTQLAAARPVSEPILRLMKQLPASDGMDMLRTLTSALGQYDPEVNDSSPQAQYRKAVRLTANGQASSPPTDGCRRAAARSSRIRRSATPRNFLYMLKGDRPSRSRRARSTSR
jgi:citrate synthase